VAGASHHPEVIGPVQSRRRILVFGPLLLMVMAALGYFGWLALQVRGDLAEAEDSAQRLRVALQEQDEAGRQAAVRDLRTTSSRAADLTGGTGWSALTHLPLVGDDATGIRALSQSLDGLARDGVDPLLRSVDLVDRLTADGRIDVRVARNLEEPVAQARSAFSEATAPVEDLDSSGYAGSVKARFDEYVDIVRAGRDSLASGETASKVLPTMVGSEGPRDYLLVFQNNAEIRATGGLPGSWALVHADQGRLSIERQGSVRSFPERPEPVLPLSEGELAVYDRQLGTFFADAGFTPDFPRAAELMRAHWVDKYPATGLDGVIALDPVALSYALEGTGPVEVDGRTLTPDNVIDELLSRPYRTLDPLAQDRHFALAAREIFKAATTDVKDPVAFVQGLSRAADEDRLRVASFVPSEEELLAGSAVIGDLPPEDGRSPRVEITLNDATGSKMSYYLRYGADVESTGCRSDVQSMTASMRLGQSIPPGEAAELPDSVTGGGQFGTQVGTQLVLVRVHGPSGGSLEEFRMNGKAITARPVELDGRPVATVVVLLSTTEDVVVSWSMTSGPGQMGDVQLGMTPSVVPGDKDQTIESTC
jgi:Protein of unknown function (DUF4012)